MTRSSGVNAVLGANGYEVPDLYDSKLTRHADEHAAMGRIETLSQRQSGGTLMVDWNDISIGTPTTGWTVTLDSTILFGGAKTLKIVSTAGAADTMTCTLTIPSTFFGGCKRFGFAVKPGNTAIVGDATNPVALWLNYSAGSTHRVKSYAHAALAVGDWAEGVVFDQDDTSWGHLAGTPVWAKVATEAVTTILMVVTKTAGQAVSDPVYVSPIYSDAMSPATLTIFMDGQYSGQWSYARQILAAYNFKASLAILPYWVGVKAGTMSEAQLLKMDALGHELITHTGTAGPGAIDVGWDNTTKYPDGSEYAGVLADLTASRDWMRARGLTRGIDYAVVGFSNGLVNTQTLARRTNISNAIRDAGILKVRQNGDYDLSYYGCAQEADLVVTPVYLANAASLTATMTGIIDALIARGGWSGLGFHDFKLTGAAGNDVLAADFETVMDHIATKVAAGTLRVRLFSEAMQEFDAIPVPV